MQQLEFPRHTPWKFGKQTYAYITDINDFAGTLETADEYELIFDNAVLADLYSVLNEREQLVIKAHYILGYSYKAIAEKYSDIFTNKHAAEVVASRSIKKMQEYAKAHKISA